MDAYIEIESLRSFIDQQDDSRYEECRRMMKRNLSIFFPFTKEEALADLKIQTWFKREMTSGVIAQKPQWGSSYPNSDFELSLKGMTVNKICALYLLDDESPQPLSKALLVSCCGKELDTLSKLFVNSRCDYDYSLIAPNISNWKILESYVTPCTDLLIVDRYILSRADRLDKNLYRILRALVSQTKNCCVNIVIVVESNQIDSRLTLENLESKIKEFVTEIVDEEPKVTFVLCKKGTFNEALFHDRRILTNYRYIDSGDSFNYLDKNGKNITGGFEVTVNSLAKQNDYLERVVIGGFLTKIQLEVKFAAQVFGDKSSRFLHF